MSDLNEQQIKSMIEHAVEESVEKAVEKALQQTLIKFGFDVDHPLESQADKLYVRKLRKSAEQISTWTRRTILLTLLSALMAVIATGLKLGIAGAGGK